MSMIADIRAKVAVPKQPLADGARKVLRNTYLLLGLTLLPTIVGAAIGVNFPITLYLGFMGHIFLFLAAMIGLQIMVVRNRHSVAGVNWLLAFTFALGYFLGPILSIALSLSNGVELIAIAMGGTAAIFFVLAGYATTTSHNFHTPGIGKTLVIGIFVAFGASMIGMFLQIPGLSLALSAVWIILSSGFIVYTINGIVRGGETNYILTTLTVYIMLYSLFHNLLFLLMSFAGGRD